jgi:hypothetical protein
MITADNYYSLESNRQYMSCHQYTQWLACPAREAARQRGEYVEPVGDALVCGTYVDAVLTTPDQVDRALERKDHEGVTYRERLQTKVGKPNAVRLKAEEIIARLRRDPDAVLLLSGQGQAVVNGELTGHRADGSEFRCPWKGMVDVLHLEDSLFVDLKTAADFEPCWKRARVGTVWQNVKKPWFCEYDYPLQIAVYRELIRQQSGKECRGVILAATKQTPPDIGAWAFDDTGWLSFEITEALDARIPGGWDAKRHGGAQGLEAVLKMKTGEVMPTRCEVCDYCRATKTLPWYAAHYSVKE